MSGFILRGFSKVIIVVICVSLIVFFLMHLSGDPINILLPLDASEQQRAELRTKFGLDQPMLVQYYKFVTNAMTGDFGNSIQHRRPAMELVLERYPNTFLLALTAVGLGLATGLPLGILGALKPGSAWERAALMVSMLGQSIPVFWLGMILILVFAVSLRVLPTSGSGGLQHFVMPAVTLSFGFLAQVVLIVRSGMLEVLQEDYIRTAYAKGLGTRAVVIRHAFRNTLIPLVTYVGLTFGTLLGGAVITETVFSWPGVGMLAVNGIFARDYPMVQASVFTLSVGIAMINLVVDLGYGFLDPRIRRA